MPTSFNKRCRSLLIELEDSPKLKVTQSALPAKTRTDSAQQAIDLGFSKEFLETYAAVSGFSLAWQAAEESSVKGTIQFLPLGKVVQSWEGTVYFKDTSPKDPIRQFYPLDFFVDEACVGVYPETNRLYFYNFEDPPFDLELDLNGYIELAFLTKGYLYWQKIIQFFLTKESNSIVKHYEAEMPVYFPENNLSELEKAFKRYKLP